jgi:hypothetical protein
LNSSGSPVVLAEAGFGDQDVEFTSAAFPVRLGTELDRILIAQNEIEMPRINPVEGRSVSHASAETFPRNDLRNRIQVRSISPAGTPQ